jgi:hypothetical protein
VPSVVFEPETNGFGEVLQQIPLTVIAAPPLEVTVPPETAVDKSIADTKAVVSVGTTIGLVVNVISFP